MRNGERVILTNEASAIGEWISVDIEPRHVSVSGGDAISYNLALRSLSLVVGKGSSKLADELSALYIGSKDAAKEIDTLENFNFESDAEKSEFVSSRLA